MRLLLYLAVALLLSSTAEETAANASSPEAAAPGTPPPANHTRRNAPPPPPPPPLPPPLPLWRKLNSTRLLLRCSTTYGHLKNVTVSAMRPAANATARVVRPAVSTVYKFAEPIIVASQERLDDARHSVLAVLRDRLRGAQAYARLLLKRDRAVTRVLRRAEAKEWYKVLQVGRRATKKEIKDAYRRLARRVHPDKTRDDRAAQGFDTLRSAFELLNDQGKRERYDKELARADELARQRRQRQYAAAARVARRAWHHGAHVAHTVTQHLWDWAQEYPRIAMAVVVIIALYLA